MKKIEDEGVEGTGDDKDMYTEKEGEENLDFF